MKFYVTQNRFKNYNGACTYYPETGRGDSYSWWRAVDKIGPFRVINACRYSNQTAKHLGKIRHVMRELGHKIDFELYFPKGINEIDPNTCYGGYRHYYSMSVFAWYAERIQSLENAMRVKGTRKSTNEERAAAIVQLKLELEAVKLFQRLHKARGNARAKIIRKLHVLQPKIARGRTWSTHNGLLIRRRPKPAPVAAVAAELPVSLNGNGGLYLVK